MKALATLIGAVLGLVVVRHWIGAVAGAGLGWLIGSGVLRRLLTGLAAGRSAAVMPAVFVLLGRLARADGHVSEAEIALCERLMQRLHLDTAARQAAIAAFNAGKREQTDLSAAFATLRDARRHAGLFLEVFVDMALADGELHADERRLLGKYTWMLGLRESALEAVLARHGRPGPRRHGDDGDPYVVLGLPPGASDAEIRRAYRRLVSEHHPDKLAARGAAPETIRLAQQRTQAILAAYERLKSIRGMK